MWTEWFQTKKHFVLKNVKPHWTVLYQVIKKWKNSEAPSGVKAKKKRKKKTYIKKREKNIAAQQKMEMNGEDLGNCCQAEFPSDWPHIQSWTLQWSWKELLILHVTDSREPFQISKKKKKLFPKCILIRLADRGGPSDIKRCVATKAS